MNERSLSELWLRAVSWIAAGAIFAWWTAAAFIGGTLWPLGIELEGSIALGVLFVLVVNPVVAAILYWAFAFIISMVVFIAAARQRKHEWSP